MTSMRFPRGPAAMLAAAALALPAWAPEAGAQYFGRNKVQWEQFDFRVLRSEHFDLHYYPAESVAVADAARMAERWYARQSRALGHTYPRKPLVFYADHPDFQQTNIIGGFISQGTGGVTESIRNRVVMPFTGVYRDNDHVLGHELVHVFQYDIAAGTDGAGLRGMSNLGLWVIEGMAEYLSIGRDDPHTAMWLRDAALRNDLPTIRKLNTDPRYFPYRYGQALWAYIGGRWGDQMVPRLYRAAIRVGWEPAVRQILRVSSDSLSAQWLAAIRETYTPVMAGRQKPGEVGTRLLEQGEDGDMDLAPTLSPDGRHVAFFTRRGLFSIDLYVADAETGRIVKKLTGPNTDAHFDALSFINSAGSWSPDGRKLAFVTFYEGDNAIAIFDLDRRRVERQVKVEGVGAITDPAWGPDNQIVFSGLVGGISDLFVLDLDDQRVRRLTNDRYADLQPAWTADGRRVAFATDRGPGTSFDSLTTGPMRVGVLEVATGELAFPVPELDGAKQINPQWSPDGTALYFISDRGGFSDIYRHDLAANTTTQVTRLATGVSGITYLSPALSVAQSTGRLVFSVFDRAGYSLFRLEAAQAQGSPVQPDPPGTRAIAGILPPIDAQGSLVSAYLADPLTGLTDGGYRASDYDPAFELEYVGSPGVGGGVGGRGVQLFGGVALYFGDMLADNVTGGTVQVAGDILNTGGEVFYLNRARRWNWLVSGSHIPYLYTFGQLRADDPAGCPQPGACAIYEIVEWRTFVEQLSGTIQYPFSTTRRVEFSAAAARQWNDLRADRFALLGNSIVDHERVKLDAPPGITYGQASLAYVGDYSTLAFTSPVAGARYRFELSPTFGEITFQTALADYRRYFYLRPVTLAFRGLHYGRYGKDAEDRQRLSDLFIGQPYFVRGYESGSFTIDECTINSANQRCPEFERLIGSRIGVASAELRIPFLGPGEFAIVPFNYLPLEVSPFFDAGVAWRKGESADLRFDRDSPDRVPVFSAGVTLRTNLLGFAVVETFFAYPFQRRDKGWEFGWQLAPGW